MIAEPGKVRIGARIVIGLELAVARACREAGVIKIGFVERVADGIVVAFVVKNVQVVDQRSEIGLRGADHLTHGEAHIAAIGIVVRVSRLDHHHQPDVEQAILKTVDDLHQGIFFVDERRVPVRSVIQNEQDVRTLRRDVRIREEEIRVVVHRVVGRIRRKRREGQRR
ncbi:MAG: hypothetical protein ACT4P8_00985 [Betaproteobacteria bacterium]